MLKTAMKQILVTFVFFIVFLGLFGWSYFHAAQEGFEQVTTLNLNVADEASVSCHAEGELVHENPACRAIGGSGRARTCAIAKCMLEENPHDDNWRTVYNSHFCASIPEMCGGGGLGDGGIGESGGDVPAGNNDENWCESNYVPCCYQAFGDRWWPEGMCIMGGWINSLSPW